MAPIRIWILWICALTTILTVVGCKSNKGEEVMQRPTLSPKRAELLLADVNEAQLIVDRGVSKRQTVKAAEAAYEQIQQDYAELVDFDLGLLAQAETFLAKQKRAKATKKYQKITNDYPQSDLLDVCYQRLFEIGSYYLEGPVIANLLLFRIRGYDRGIKVLENLTEDVGLNDPNGYGVRATIDIAENLEARAKVQDAYLKWLELSTEWDEGPLHQMALLGMARTKLEAYKQPPEQRRAYYNGANLTNAREYYQQFIREYPEDANEMNIVDIIEEIDALTAAHQLTIARYYERTGRKQAANLYLDMVIENWPDTAAAQTARETMAQQKPSVQ
jgi:outer membrane protein assembly factor BamD (BamD/ComL family)